MYYTDKQIMEATGKVVDVESLVEQPYIHMLGRSSSTIEDQAKFHIFRLQCIQDLSSDVISKQGYPIIDVLRIFHGDGPAQQIERQVLSSVETTLA